MIAKSQEIEMTKVYKYKKCYIQINYNLNLNLES